MGGITSLQIRPAQPDGSGRAHVCRPDSDSGGGRAATRKPVTRIVVGAPPCALPAVAAAAGSVTAAARPDRRLMALASGDR